MAVLLCYLGKPERRVQKADTTSICCHRHEAGTGVIRSSQSFEYRERLDECSGQVRALSTEGGWTKPQSKSER